MSTVQQGPPPTILSVISQDKSLVVNWENDNTYVNSTGATLIYSTASDMQSIMLTEAQILDETYTITGLTNGVLYTCYISIYSSQTGTTNNSASLGNTPSGIPFRPTINSYTIGSGNTSVTMNVTNGDGNGSNATKMVFRLMDDSSHNQMYSYQFDMSANSTTNDFTITGLTTNHTYTICAQVINVQGYSSVSNSIQFNMSPVLAAPVLATIGSGLNLSLACSVTGVNSSQYPLQKLKYQTSIDGTTWLNKVEVPNSGSAAETYNIPFNIIYTTGTTPLLNNTGYYVRVYASNSAGDSLVSNVQTGAPYQKIVYSGLLLDFSGNNVIKLSWSDNSVAPGATNASTEQTTILFQDADGYVLKTVVVPYSSGAQPYTQTYTSPTPLEIGNYSATINGYTVVGQSLYTNFWKNPVLVDLQYDAAEKSIVKSFASVPDPVTEVNYVTDISGANLSTGGIIAYNFVPPTSDGGSAITGYSVQLYSNTGVSGASWVVVGSPQNITTSYGVFRGLDVSKYYRFTIVAQNIIGDSLSVQTPSTNAGILITDSTDPVTSLFGQQTTVSSGGDISGNLSWNWGLKGTNVNSVKFQVYQVNGLGLKILIGEVPYNAANPSAKYNQALALGILNGVSFDYEVIAIAFDNGNNPYPSIPVHYVVTTGLAPLISAITGVNNTDGVSCVVSFTISNLTQKPMILNSIISQFLPSAAFSNVNSFQQSIWDVTLVPLGGSYLYSATLQYALLSQDGRSPIGFVTAANTYGTAYRPFGYFFS
jgi:hypothetical protein